MDETKKADYQPLRVALEKIAGDLNKAFLYESGDDFDRLWGFVENTTKLTGQALIVVATDDFLRGNDNGPSNLAPWITVDAWVMALAVAYGRRQVEPPPSVYLLDLRTGEQALRDQEMKEVLPFLRRFLPKPSHGGRLKFLDDLCTAIMPVVPQDERKGSTSHMPLSGVKLFEHIRRNAVRGITSGGRHDASNEIGAMIMRAGMKHVARESGESRRVKAVRILVETLLSSAENPDLYPIIEALRNSADTKINRHLFPPEDLCAFLIDDRHAEGYCDVLSQAIGQNVECWTGIFDPEIEDGASEEKPTQILCTEYKNLKQASDLHAFAADILFLDLRLWREDDQENKDKALKKYGECLELLGWDKEVREKLRELVEADASSHRSLALLPLILSRLDPALPIILFSSTQHRSVIQKVSGAPSIITDFAKPYVGGDDRDGFDPVTVMRGLRLAVERAAEMIEIRQVWRAACEHWKGKDLIKLSWAENSGWPKVELSQKTSPLVWLRETWLPLAQRREYALAAAAPWIYLRRILKDTRIAILTSSAEDRNAREYLRIVQDAQDVPLVKMTSAPVTRELAVTAAMALVGLVSLWTKPPNGQL